MKKRERLEAAIRAATRRWCAEPFAWGSTDCLLSLSDIIKEARGYDPASPFRGRYTTRIGAFRVTREYGGFEGALEAMAHDAGWREISPKDAFIGDIGIQDHDAICGLIRDRQLWVGRYETGFRALPTEYVGRAWRVA